MKTKPCKIASQIIGSMIRQAFKNQEWFMLGYARAKRREMQKAGQLSVAAYIDGWRLAQ